MQVVYRSSENQACTDIELRSIIKEDQKSNIEIRSVNDVFQNLNKILKKRIMSLETKYLNTRQYLFSYITGVAKCYNI